MPKKIGRKAALLIAVVALALTMAVVGVANGLASTKPRSTTTLAIGGKVALVGGGVYVSITYTCFPGGYAGKGGYSNFGDVRVGDIQGHQGFRFWQPTCNNKKQTSVLFVPGSFVAGPGAVSAFVCGFDCNGTSRPVKIS